ncbi:hypothetical protein HBI56_149270 [Parastagonospora nodorum]|uniref:Rhodanese domain-containing protein n=2 Tax=Phaeosphaeria nodorum (strain SN15 / ATCC MYA-4574 / FGSC 10173) TaxID=321614 RepID=A0A7U2IBK9_PHANO|nr:hypothetical protein SNOG_12758 [Parastagonospora nodorum SN15]KAH3915514.1 hypothetical protein HBH56_075590 [Parastagonospora nodorum]EAT80056.1 hypothetical protein SNOG_12758 [Parastagonospora nodorum SN15]KAH3927458.1 hypothetical protein HBH54_155830 [Parastagonospora nodorum]KAH3951988.1 hypothetical protein HBH53_052570 [Parastagonospora nodorum]KAH3981886.1 hypothetical protein HBH51_042540 [Parastagonospora nodorum]
MSNLTLANLEYISREDLAARIKSTQTPNPSNPSNPSTALPPNIAVVDVRDSDHIGGHIRGSTWLPSAELDYKTPELIRTMKDKEVVVFHCALSQQRGPSAALRYLRERERLIDMGDVGKKDEGEGVGSGKEQKVLVLKGGFTEWQEKYGADEGLTEGWRKDIWEWGT